MDGSGLVHGDDFVFVTRRWLAKEVEKRLHSNWDVGVQTFGPGDDDGKHGRILNSIVRSRANGTGNEADHKHAALRANKNFKK